MTRKQSTERLWPPTEKKEHEKHFTVQEVEKTAEVASFSLDPEAVARALAPSLQKCPACEPCPQQLESRREVPKYFGHLNVREGILILGIAVLALATLICALICVSITSKSTQAIIKLESLLRL
jgi:hypothetical protein